MFDINNLVRDNIKKLEPYSSARSEFSGQASVFLDANENSYGSPLEKNYNRYPDPLQRKLKEKIGKIKQIDPQYLFLGNGSDECIDLLLRAFCNPGKDNIITCPPTYGMYKVSAKINDIEVREAKLDGTYQLQPELITAKTDLQTKVLFICSPNNPSGNSIRRKDIEALLEAFDGIVVVDEAYIDFSKEPTFIHRLDRYPNLVVLQTFSKAWGLAALRLGMLYGNTAIIDILNRIKPPYNINQATQEIALEALENEDQMKTNLKNILEQREILRKGLEGLDFISDIAPSDSNFLLVRMNQAHSKYEALIRSGIVVRDRSRVVLCEDCLRITVGTTTENQALIQALKDLE